MAWRETSHLTRRIARDRKNQRADAQHRERRKKTRTKTQALDGAPLHPSLAKALDETAGTQTDAKTLAACVPRDRVRKWAEHCARALAQSRGTAGKGYIRTLQPYTDYEYTAYRNRIRYSFTGSRELEISGVPFLAVGPVLRTSPNLTPNLPDSASFM